MTSRRTGREPSPAAAPEGRGTKKEQFELLYGILKAYHDSSLDTALKAMGFLLLVMGWVLTSENARVFLARDQALQWASIAVLAMAAVLFALFARRVLLESRATFRALEALDYIPVQY